MSTYLESFRASAEYKALLERALSITPRELRPEFRTAYHKHTPSKYPDDCTGWEGYPDEPGAWCKFLDDSPEAYDEAISESQRANSDYAGHLGDGPHNVETLIAEDEEARKERLAERLAKAAEGTAYQDFDFYSLLP